MLNFFKKTKNKHFEFVKNDTVTIHGRVLHRIRATRDIPSQYVKTGDLGGYVEKLENLSDDAWVHDNARVSGNALVSGDALVYGDARVYGYTRVRGNAKISASSLVSRDPLNIIGDKHSITITDNFVHIGCKDYEIEELLKLKKWRELHSEALKYKGFIKQAIKLKRK